MVVAGCGPGAAPSTAGQSSGAAQEGSTAQESSDSTSAETSSAAEVEITGATSSERAIQGLKALNLPAGTKFTVFSEDLTIKMAEVNAEEFNKQTGLELETQTAPFLEHRTKIMQDAINKAGAYDMVILQTSWMGDFYNAGYLTPLTEWANKYNPDIEDMIAPFNNVWSHHAGEIYGLPTDGDTWILYYRKDLFEDPKEQEAFKAKYGHDLKSPATWDEFNNIAEFFTRPDQNLYGATEWRVKGVTYWWFFERLGSLGGTYFGDGMKPAINSSEGVKALEDLKAMNQYMAPDVLSFGYVETVAAFSQGQAAMLITWPAAGKNFVDAKASKVIGKVGYTTVPGYEVDGKPNPKTMTVPGYSMVVNSNTKNPKEAVYLVAQWLTSTEQLKRANMNLSGNTDVLRESVFSDPEMRQIFDGAGEYLDAQKANIAQGFPEPILPGYDEYMQALEIEISRYMTDEISSAQEVLDNAAAEWEKITDKHGRDKQAELYEAFLTSYYEK
jgi:multiple sugar transport system substrate-binding protein